MTVNLKHWYLHLTSSFEFIDSSEHGPLAMLQPRPALRKESSETYLMREF